MIYTRGEILELVRKEPEGLQPIITAIIWCCSRCDTNLILENRRFGLCAVHIAHAQMMGFDAHQNRLLDPELNIKMASEILQELGLLEYLGRDFAAQFHAITALARFLTEPSNTE